ncbi:hypothetical protein B0T17DRAFT_523694 [Bombardia bombarda]|uniref:Uncharacterized protein n=1 Tax=Bombardia bombarda TaxID=252184 RepID=A0AA40C8S4_9PEZI|nr:hypothetical protein B0T17DRAFT_523694 [Bombardia bombarda]
MLLERPSPLGNCLRGAGGMESTDTAAMSGLQLFDAFLSQNPQIRFIHLQWLDFTSTVRARVFPIRYMRQMLEMGKSHRLGGLNMTLIDDTAPLTADNPSGPVGEPIGQGRLIPDLSSIRACPGLHAHAYIFCNFASVPGNTDEKTLLLTDIFPFCPRTALQRVLFDAKSLGLNFLVGFEIEFVCTQWQPPQSLSSKSAATPPAIHQTSGLRSLEANGMLPVLCSISTDGVLISAFGDKLASTYMKVIQEYNRRLDRVGPLGSKERINWLTARL